MGARQRRRTDYYGARGVVYAVVIAMTMGCIVLAPPTALAGHIPFVSNFDGVALVWTLDSDGTDGQLMFQAAFTTLLNGDPITIVTTTIADFTIDATSGVGGTYTFDPSSYVGGLVYDDGGGMAVFNLDLTSLEVVNPSTLVVTGAIELASNTSAEDFSPFGAGPGDIIFTLNTPPGLLDLDDVIANSGTAIGSGSFSAAAVPEPSSATLGGLALAAFVMVFRRRMRQRRG